MTQGRKGGYLMRVNADIEDVLDVLYSQGSYDDLPFLVYDVYEISGLHQYEVMIEVEDRYFDEAVFILEREGMGVMADA